MRNKATEPCAPENARPADAEPSAGTAPRGPGRLEALSEEDLRSLRVDPAILPLLRESERRIRSILHAIPDIMFVHEQDGRLSLFHAPGGSPLFHRPEEFLNRPLEELFPSEIVAQTREAVRGCLETDSIRTFRYTLPFDGQTCHYEARMVPYDRKRTLSIVRDVTHLVRAEEERELQTAAQSVRIAVRSLTPDADEALILETLLAGIRRHFNVGIARYAPGADPAAASPESRQGAEPEMVLPLVVGGSVEGLVSVAAPKSGRFFPGTREHLEALLADAAGTLSEARTRGAIESELRQAQKMEAVGKLAGGVAHDFNNLLHAIIGYTSLVLKHTRDDTGAASHLQHVLEAAQRGETLVRQLLAFGRRDAHQPEVLDLDILLKDLLTMVRRLIGEDIVLEHLQRPLPCLIRADRSQIEQLVINLCLNARDAMPDGGRIRFRTSRTEIRAQDNTGHTLSSPFVVLEITDTGPGIPEAHLDRIFEPFFTTKEPGKGTGLGLSTVYAIADRHGGGIRAGNAPEGGAVFTVHLPAADSREMAAEGVSTSARPLEFPAPGGTETILVAEDDPAVRELAVCSLQEAGYTVLAACDGREAVELFTRHADGIDGLVFDVVMPGLSGRRAYEAIVQTAGEIPVVFCSGYTDEFPAMAVGEGTTGRLLRKPYENRELLKALRDLLDATGGSPPAS